MIARSRRGLQKLARAIVTARTPLACVLSVVVGVYGYTHHPFPTADPVAVLMAAHAPALDRIVRMLYLTLWFTTPWWVVSVLGSLVFVFLGGTAVEVTPRPLPPYPAIRQRRTLCLVLGERHHATERQPSPTPTWLTIPARGLHAGICVIGATGSGKTAGAMYPFAHQLFAFAADDPARKLAGLILEVKGDFCPHLQRLLRGCGRTDDYVELNLARTWRYNPLHQGHDAYAMAYAIASVMNQVWGHSPEPFWELAATNVIKFIILLHQVLYGYVTFTDVYSCAISPQLLETRIREAGRLPEFQPGTIVVPLAAHAAAREATQNRVRWEPRADGTSVATDASATIVSALTDAAVPFVHHAPPENERQLQYESVRLWYEHDWKGLDQKLRSAIIEGISVFLSLFESDPDLRYTFCPPKIAYADATGKHGRVLPPMSTLIERGRVCALNLPVASNPALARTIGTALKMDFQRAMLARIPKMQEHADRVWRDVVFWADEYQVFATVGANHPGGDEQFFALSRQSKCIPIVSTQSIASLRSTLPPHTPELLLAQFRTKLFLNQTDPMSAQFASDLCGRTDQLRPAYHVSETGRDAGISLLNGRAVSTNASLGTTKVYGWQREVLFEPKVFLELKNMEAIAVAYDGTNVWPPQRLYLKPYYLPVQATHFDHVAAGAL